MPSTRVQEALEQIQENESLMGDLTDRAATAVLAWITQRVEEADAQTADDEAFSDQVVAIRRAVRRAAQAAADAGEEHEPDAVIVRAAAALGGVTTTPQPPTFEAVEDVPPLIPPLPGNAQSAPVQPTHESRVPSADPTALLRKAPIPRKSAPPSTEQPLPARGAVTHNEPQPPTTHVSMTHQADEALPRTSLDRIRRRARRWFRRKG